MPGSVESWSISRTDPGLSATLGDRTIVGANPSELWLLLAEATLGKWLHIADPHTKPDIAALGAAMAELERSGADAAVARVLFSDGQVSRATKSTVACRFLNSAPGSLLVRAGALSKAAGALDRTPADAFWMFDLVSALHAVADVRGSSRIFGRCDRPIRHANPGRIPLARAHRHRQAGQDTRLILVYGQIEASISLYFDALPRDLQQRLRFLKPGDLSSDMAWLASADLVLVVRGFEHMVHSASLALLQELGVPYAWFTDDDFSALHAEVPSFSYYTQQNLRGFLSNAAGIVTTTPALKERLTVFHPNVILWPCLFDENLAAARPNSQGGRFRVGAFGGSFRNQCFRSEVLPALAELGSRKPTSIFANNDIARDIGVREITRIPFQPEFHAFVRQWQRLRLQAIVHPFGISQNIGNKSRASLLVAAYLGAVPVVGDEPAYADIGEAQGVLKVRRGVAADWLVALERLSDPIEAGLLLQRLDAWCRETFAPERARSPFDALLKLALPADPVMAAMRWQAAGTSDALRRAVAKDLESPKSPVARKDGKLRRAVRKIRRSLKKNLAKASARFMRPR